MVKRSKEVKQVIDNPNQTQQDAFERVLDARLGSHVGASDTYLLALEGYLYQWIDEIKAELQHRVQKNDD